MNVIVCIKQVPESAAAGDDRGILDRSRGGGCLNPGDRDALEAARTLAECTGGRVTALTMGPESAEAVVRTAFSMGADRGILLSDPAFAGADVYATAHTLAEAIRSMEWDIIVCGQSSADGDTAQLPFSLAARLEIPAIGWVKHLHVEENDLVLLQELSGGTQEVRIGVPCVIAMEKGACRPRIPGLRDQLRAKKREVLHMGLPDLSDRNPEHYGLAGSKTRVVSVKRLENQGKCPAISCTPAEAAEILLDAVREVHHG